MVISHKYKYVFVELPRTGSSAIRTELCEHYDGSKILLKHSTYFDFLKNASEAEKDYFVFSCIRHPLDQTVSRYFKLKHNHRERFTRPKALKKRTPLVKLRDTTEFNFIQEHEADFAHYFLKYYKVPYCNWSILSHKDFDFVIRFENLADDFAKVLALLDIEPVRRLPEFNKTAQRNSNFFIYYTPETRERAKRVFGPFMKIWGYNFPPEWGEASVPWWNQLQFDFLNIFRVFYWKYLRFRV
jgi:hypothetical protein